MRVKNGEKGMPKLGMGGVTAGPPRGRAGGTLLPTPQDLRGVGGNVPPALPLEYFRHANSSLFQLNSAY